MIRPMADSSAAEASAALRASLVERLRDDVPPAMLDVVVERHADLYVARPRDWGLLREQEAEQGRPPPYWAMPWPSGLALAEAVAATRLAGRRVLEVGCGLAVPSIAAARAGAGVLATDASEDAVVFAAHNLALNESGGEAAVASWEDLRGPWDLVLAADVAYLQRNVEGLVRVLPQLVAPDGELWIADPDRAGARDLLAGLRRRFTLRSERGEVALHRLTRA
jgi:predicted nicotinamide N-methyase